MSGGDVCEDNRFKIIEAAKERLLYYTNIETSPEEMKCLNSFLYRCWQMKWIDERLISPGETERFERIKESDLRMGVVRYGCDR